MNALVQVQPNAFAVSDLAMMARAFAGSRLFGIQNEEQALALCLVAQAEGRHPASAAQDYHIVQGRPAKKADAMLRDFISSGGKVEWHSLTDELADATFSHPAGGSVRITWDHQRARAAGLGGKDMWKKFPRQMLRSRVVSEGVRTVCPGATSGMYVPEEVQEFAPAEARDVTDESFAGTPQPPLPKSKARDVYDRLCKGLREAAKGTEDDLTVWYQNNADDVGSMPHDWRGQLREEYGDALKTCRARAADPYGLLIDTPETDEPGAWMEYVEDVLAAIAGAPDEDQVRAAQTVNASGIAKAAAIIEGAAEKIAEASEARLSALMAKAA